MPLDHCLSAQYLPFESAARLRYRRRTIPRSAEDAGLGLHS
jgi:hypothetical protein